MPKLENLRASQRLVWDRIQQFASFFFEPIPQWSGRLLTWAMKTGSGKTVAKAIVPCAINYAIKQTYGSLLGRPRVRKLLVVAKDSNSREQLASEFRDELVQHNIWDIAPTVRSVKGLDQLDQATSDPTIDIVVCCIQTLWLRDSDTQRETFCEQALECLHRCQVICFDEMHWGRQKILELVNSAEYSACFGFTATPIDHLSEVFSQIVLCGVYGRDKAITNDSSMSEIDRHQSLLVDQLDDLQSVNTHIDVDGQRIEADNGDDVGQYKVEIDRVAKNVIECMYRLDHLSPEEIGTISAHRQGQQTPANPWRPTTMDNLTEQIVNTFPVHAIIRVSRVATIKATEDAIQRYLEAHRDKFPAEQGWNASSVYHGKKLGSEHAWMRFLKNGLMDSLCARILIVDQMAQENTNNRYCGITAYAKPVPPLPAAVQGIGRAERTMHLPATNEVPPAKLDRSYVITSSSFNQNGIIESAIDFALNMEEQILRCDPETLDDFTAHRQSDSPWQNPEDDNVGLKISAKMRVIGQMCEWFTADPTSAPQFWSWASDVASPPSTITDERSQWPRLFKAAYELCEAWIQGDGDKPPVLPGNVYAEMSELFACGSSIADFDLPSIRVAEHGHREIVNTLEIGQVVEEARRIDEAGRGFARLYAVLPDHPAVRNELCGHVTQHYKSIDRGGIDRMPLEPVVEQTVANLAKGMDGPPSFVTRVIRPAVKNIYAQVVGVPVNDLYDIHPKREAALVAELQSGNLTRQIMGKAFLAILDHQCETTNPYTQLFFQGAHHGNG